MLLFCSMHICDTAFMLYCRLKSSTYVVGPRQELSIPVATASLAADGVRASNHHPVRQRRAHITAPLPQLRPTITLGGLDRQSRPCIRAGLRRRRQPTHRRVSGQRPSGPRYWHRTRAPEVRAAHGTNVSGAGSSADIAIPHHYTRAQHLRS
jgi:hypothetical protein